MQPGLKDLTDHFLEEWFWRPAAIVSYSAGRIAGARSALVWHGTDDDLYFYAVTRALQIISEALRRLPADMKERHPHIPWAEMAGAGNVYRHDCEDVEHRLVWGTVHNRFPALLTMVELELQQPGAAR
jgi:uncharacterized protein with HEPN domain